MQKTGRLRNLVVELGNQLDQFEDPSDSQIELWRQKMHYAIGEIQGPSGALAIKFSGLPWTHFPKDMKGITRVYVGVDLFQEVKKQSHDILTMLQFLLEQFDDTTAEWDSAIDPELWDHVNTLVRSNDWNKVPVVVAAFLENKLRTWANIGPQTKGSTEVFKQAIGARGYFPLGDTDDSSEVQGWSQLSVGFALAIRNSAAHGEVKERYAKQYAFGVIGLASLIITELKDKYGDPPVNR